MKYDEVIRDFREMYRERVEQYVERFIQQCYIGTGEGLRESKEDTAGNRYFEIDFEEFKKWMEAEISSIDGKIGENTAKDIQDIYYTPEIISTSDTGYREQEETSKYTIPSPVHSTYRMYLETGKRQVYEGSIREAKAFACTVMNGCPIPLKDGDNTIFIGDGEVFYISPAGLIETLNKGSRAGSFVQYDTDKTNLPKGSNRVDIYRISESGMTFCEERNQSGGFKKTEKITVPLKDENGDFITDLDVFTEGVKMGYNHPWLVANLSQEDASKLASTLRGVLQRTSSSFVALETETELRKKVEELQASLDGKEAGIVELMSSYTDRSGKAEASISSLREENESLRRTQEEQSAQIQTLQQNNAQLETRAKTAEENSDSLRQRIEQLKEKVIQAVGKVPFVGKKVKSIFDEDVLALPPQTQKEDDFRARLQVTEPTDDKEIMDEMCKIERRIKEEAQPPMRKRKSHVTQLPMKRRVSEKDDDKFER